MREIRRSWDEVDKRTKSVNFFLNHISQLIRKIAPKFEVPSDDSDIDDDNDNENKKEDNDKGKVRGVPHVVSVETLKDNRTMK
ncbi:hypothetical protein KQX54_007688 [Cotesia glomerata]|uniref:Uncharacterized protein n=1 Tax=Cotesia glomerata TaxID=32391 RepID=A0AAV7IQE9_COTGL|nr:hypothetical protein KQX54_007688 [Cotesia glomerata]